jgi:hypothetical protein
MGETQGLPRLCHCGAEQAFLYRIVAPDQPARAVPRRWFLPDKAIYLPCGDRLRLGLPTLCRDLPVRRLPAHPSRVRGRQRHARVGRHPPARVRHLHRPSFGPVHTHLTNPRARVGRSLCPDSYDHSAAVVWNAHAPELWWPTVITIRRRLAKLAKAHSAWVKLSYAKVGEFQCRGLIHFHAIFRFDGLDPVHPERIVPPHPTFTADVPAGVVRQAATATAFTTASHHTLSKRASSRTAACGSSPSTRRQR